MPTVKAAAPAYGVQLELPLPPPIQMPPPLVVMFAKAELVPQTEIPPTPLPSLSAQSITLAPFVVILAVWPILLTAFNKIFP